MGVFQLCALAVGGLFMVLLLRQYHPVFAVLISLALSAVLLWQAVSLLQEMQKTLGTLFCLSSGSPAMLPGGLSSYGKWS